jgi:hypothetical protein
MQGAERFALAANYLFEVLFFIDIIGAGFLGHIPGAVEALSALAAPVGAKGEEEQQPEFQNASTLGAMHVVAAAQRTLSFSGIHKQPKDTFHWQGMIAPRDSARNRQPRLCYRSGHSANQNDARTCMA